MLLRCLMQDLHHWRTEGLWMTWSKCSLCRMITDIPPSYQEKPAEMVRKHSCKHHELARVASNMESFHLLSGARTSGLLPRGVKKEVLLEKQHLLDPFSQALGIRKQLRKRTGNNECFWKYCV
uniref:Urotensin 2, alpha n=1 Tax=Takifugu rubripes TaxID=31033 RepID=A0A674PA91_TAKRU